MEKKNCRIFRNGTQDPHKKTVNASTDLRASLLVNRDFTHLSINPFY